MRYTFKCGRCEKSKILDLPVSKCDSHPRCECRGRMSRDFLADWRTIQIDTSGCKDHSAVKGSAQVRSRYDGNKSPERVEREFKQHIEGRRREIRDAGGQRGSIKQTHAVPAHLYHGKIKETKDPNYWSDPKNLNRHSECKVDG